MIGKGKDNHVSLNMIGNNTRNDIYRSIKRRKTWRRTRPLAANRRPHFRFHASNNAIGIRVSRTSGNCLVIHTHTHVGNTKYEETQRRCKSLCFHDARLLIAQDLILELLVFSNEKIMQRILFAFKRSKIKLLLSSKI